MNRAAPGFREYDTLTTKIKFGPLPEPPVERWLSLAHTFVRSLQTMHDAKNRPLKVGDRVLIPARITELSATADYCNVSVESALGRRPDGKPERASAINTAVLLRSNHDDTNDIEDAFVIR